MVGDGQVAYETLFTGRLVSDGTLGKIDFFHEAFGQNVIYIIALHIQKLVFHRRAAAIDY